MKNKIKIDWWELPPLLLDLFFFTFIFLYLGKFGLEGFLFITTNEASWKFFFNLTLFYMMAIFFINSTLKSSNKFFNRRDKK